MEKTKKNRITAALGTVLFLSVFLLNISAFVKSGDQSNGLVSLKSLFSQASADDESAGSLKWSSTKQCPGIFDGEYHVCEYNGPGNSCTTEGSQTCNCGIGGNC